MTITYNKQPDLTGLNAFISKYSELPTNNDVWKIARLHENIPNMDEIYLSLMGHKFHQAIENFVNKDLALFARFTFLEKFNDNVPEYVLSQAHKFVHDANIDYSDLKDKITSLFKFNNNDFQFNDVKINNFHFEDLTVLIVDSVKESTNQRIDMVLKSENIDMEAEMKNFLKNKSKMKP